MPRKKTVAAKKPAKKAVEISLSVSLDELTFLRDLMSLMLPPDGQVTAAKALAQLTEAEKHEQSLWHKIYDACESSQLPVGDEAPDYLVAQTMGLSVYQVSKEEE